MDNNYLIHELKRRLTYKIKGDISVHITDNMIVVDIIPPGGTPVFHYTVNILYGNELLDSYDRVLGWELYYHYKNFIKAKYFY